MIILSKKGNLIMAIVALILALGLFAGAFCITYLYEFAPHVSKTFTCDRTVREDGRTVRYNMYVIEENKPLTISVNANKYLNKNAFIQLKQGDVVHCEVIEGDDGYAYEIVELTCNSQVILSLNNVKKAYKANSIIGTVITALIGAWSLTMSGILFHRSKYGYSQRYKNAEKKTIKKVLLEHAKTNGIDPQETQCLIDMIDSVDMSDDLPCEKDELLNIFKNSFYVKNNRQYTAAAEYLSNQGCHKVFREALKDVLQENELRVCYDAGLTDDSALYLLYKINGKIVDGYIFKNDETGKFPVDKLDLSGDLYDVVKLTRAEKALLVEKLREYNRLNEDIFDIDRDLM